MSQMALELEPVQALEPAVIEHRQDHRFVERLEPAHGEVAELDPYDEGPMPLRKKSCALCGHGKEYPAHHGNPGSQNRWGSGSNQRAYQAWLQMWKGRWVPLLEEADLPRPMTSVMAEGVMCFGRHASRNGPDQCNFWYPLVKSLGDALQDGGWLDDDSWLRFTFGNLEYRYSKNEWWTRVVLFPGL